MIISIRILTQNHRLCILSSPYRRQRIGAKLPIRCFVPEWYGYKLNDHKFDQYERKFHYISWWLCVYNTFFMLKYNFWLIARSWTSSGRLPRSPTASRRYCLKTVKKWLRIDDFELKCVSKTIFTCFFFYLLTQDNKEASVNISKQDICIACSNALKTKFVASKSINLKRKNNDFASIL